ncbi:MAG: hypothetical protein KAW12_06805 [Candidatus Aminicenantes bacterium]|nr:hypothetical protein [Candidatus Aminicenantes bacterium]
MQRKRKVKKVSVSERDKFINGALEVSDAERKKRTQKLYVLSAALVVVVLLVFLISKSTGKGEPVDAVAVTPTPAAEKTPQPTGTVTETAAGIVDRGTVCENHKYVIEPGAAELLRFEIKLKKEALHFGETVRNKVGNDDITIVPALEKWEAEGAAVDIQSFDIEIVSDKVNLWIVDADEFLQDYAKAAEAAGTSGKPDNIKGYINKKNLFEVNFTGSEFGVISTMGRYNHTEFKVAELTQSDITDLLGGKLLLPYDYQGKKYNMPVKRMEMEKEVYFLVIEVDVNMPKDYEKEITGCAAAFAVKLKDAPDSIFELKFSFGRDSKFHITGPAFASGCYKIGGEGKIDDTVPKKDEETDETGEDF